jgi:serine/threonine protein kinase
VTLVAAEIGSSASSYEIFGKLAKGGMAEIFLARAATAAGVARFVVLKRVLQERATDLQFLRMFLDEARLAAQLQHPNIAQVYDVGRLGDSYFFTMEYVHGVTLRELVHALQGQPVPVGPALAIAAGAAAGLHHAHERIGVDGRPLGIVHRDVSPTNLMVSFEGHVKVVDFGIAKATSRTQETHSGTVRGKISYLSPEQASGGDIDRRSDVFSLGIVMWEMLTGLRLYKRESEYLSMAAVVEEPVPSLPPGTPPALAMLVMRALAKQPEDRWQSAQSMFEAIETIATGLGTPLSSASLSRFVRELFGPRPEPWIALQGANRPVDIVTVAAEPLPQELIVPPASEIDRRLSTVLDLSASRPAIDDPMDARPTVALHIPQPTPAFGQPVAPSFAQPDSAPFTPSYAAQAAAPFTPSYPAQAATPYAAGAPRFGAMPRRGLSPLWIGTISFALAIVLALIARIYLRKPAATAAAPADEATVAVVTIDAAEAQPTVPADAAVEVAPVNASETPPVTIDAGVGQTHKWPPDQQRPRPRPEPQHPSPQPSSDWRAFAACASTGASKSPASCVEVACRLQEAGKARKWIAKVPAGKRASLIASCKIEGVELEASKLPD